MTVYDFQPSPPPSRIVQLTALRTAFPDYTFTVIRGNREPRYEAVSKTFGDPYCIISTDAREIWRELKQSVKVAEGVTVRAWLRA